MDKKIEDFGYDDFFEANRRALGLDAFSVARVTAEHRGAYEVINEKGQFSAKITGKQIFDASKREDYPAVGDWVAITELGSGKAVVQGILPRRTVIKRKGEDKSKIDGKMKTQVIGANIDVAFVVESVDRDYNLNRLERYFVLARDGGIKPAMILNKIDLESEEELNAKLAEIQNRFPDIDVIPTSITNDQGLDKLKGYISSGLTYCFLGSSGVGKSSLINKLLGKDLIKTEGISAYSGRGKHMTTSREMYFLPARRPVRHSFSDGGSLGAGGGSGGIVIDNPGMREVGMTNANSGLSDTFNEIVSLAQNCKYADCTHTHEPGCGVLFALHSGKLDEDKYNNYIGLKKEAEYYELSQLKKREKDKKFGKFVSKALKQLGKYRLK